MVKRPLILAIAALMFSAPQIAAAQSQSKASTTAKPAPKLKVGDMAPDFMLPGSDGRTYRLSDFGGRAVVIAWFPKAFTGG